MSFVPVMWIVWAVFVVVTVALLLYRSNLTKDEEDQIFLDDSFSHERSAQEAIAAKVNKIQPVVKISEILTGLATLIVVVYYVRDFFRQF
jgi:hypothetical protein